MDLVSSVEKQDIWKRNLSSYLITFVDYNNYRNGTQAIRFVIINVSPSYNFIFGRIAMDMFRVIASTIHGVVKFYTMSGVGTIPTKKKSRKVEWDFKQENGPQVMKKYQFDLTLEEEKEMKVEEKYNREEDNNQKRNVHTSSKVRVIMNDNHSKLSDVIEILAETMPFPIKD